MRLNNVHQRVIYSHGDKRMEVIDRYGQHLFRITPEIARELVEMEQGTTLRFHQMQGVHVEVTRVDENTYELQKIGNRVTFHLTLPTAVQSWAQ